MMTSEPTPFLLLRGQAGWSDIPVVAEGLITTEGRVVLAWLGERRSVAVYESIRDFYDLDEPVEFH